jgi:CheY-like chemotaxis protein
VTKQANAVLFLAKSGPSAEAIIQNLNAIRLPVHLMAWQPGGDFTEFAAEAAVEAQGATVVIVDLGAMRDNGVTLCERLQVSRGEETLPKILALGVEAEPQYEDAAYRVGCDIVVPRPFTHYELLERLRSLEVWKLRQAHRVQVELPVSWKRPDGQIVNGVSTDLSETGLQFRSEQPIPVGQNIPVAVALVEGEPPLAAWARTVRCEPAPETEAQFTAVVAVHFLNLTAAGRQSLNMAIAQVRKAAHEAPKPDEKAHSVANDYRIGQIIDWFLFLLNPAAFGGPPAPIDFDAEQLKRWVYRMAPHEERLFVMTTAVDQEVSQTTRWLRAWVALRPDLRGATEAAPSPDFADTMMLDEWVKRARASLSLLVESLAAWDQLRFKLEDQQARAANQTLLLTLREGLALRDAYDKLRDESEDRLLPALERAEDYFEERDFDAHLVRYEHGPTLEAEPRKAAPRKKEKLETPPTLRRNMSWAAAAFILLGGIGSIYLAFFSEENKLVEAQDFELISPLLQEGSYSRGKARIFIGRVKPGRWKTMSIADRREASQEIRLELERRSIHAAMIYQTGDRIAVHIDRGKVIFVE